ncbi:hypothetical protein [Microcoleus sp. PH2017_16_JOR_D_A]|uniref:hypothetical protein n=1 Tax=Microcoleus sp. PH2017_16_JOR_D_A TaxID=2798827 RepID=UPI0025DF4F47|nr:hypothetical protein [Microcoleus sp. PH2017_16_JOR_D_A]
MGWAGEPATGFLACATTFVGWAGEPATGFLQAFWPVPQLLWAVAPSPPQRCISDRLPTVYDREYVHLLIWMKFSWQLIFQIMLLNCNG